MIASEYGSSPVAAAAHHTRMGRRRRTIVGSQVSAIHAKWAGSRKNDV